MDTQEQGLTEARLQSQLEAKLYSSESEFKDREYALNGSELPQTRLDAFNSQHQKGLH